MTVHAPRAACACIWPALSADARDCSLPVAQCPASLVNPASLPATPQAWTRKLLRCGAAAGPVFAAVFLLEGAVRDGPAAAPPGQFSRARKARLDPGRDFAAAGTLVLAGAAGLARASDPAASRAAPALTGAAGAGLIASAVFATNPVSGYRQERPMRSPTPPVPASPTIWRQSRCSPACPPPHSPAAGGPGRPPAPLRPLQRRHRHNHARDRGPGRRGLRPIAPARQPRRAVPARRHHHRLCLAHNPVRTSAPPNAYHHSTTPPGSLNVSPDHPKYGRSGRSLGRAEVYAAKAFARMLMPEIV